MAYVLVHGLGLSAKIWSSLKPFLNDEIIAVDLPGHGNSQSNDISWKGLWQSVTGATGSLNWTDSTVVLHSFAACLLPEIYSEHSHPKKIVLIEGMLHSTDVSWSRNIAHLSNDDFQSWLLRFRSISEMTLKSQLVTKQPKGKLTEWSNAFKIVSGNALRGIALNMNERLNSDSITQVLSSSCPNLTYVKGSRSRLRINDSATHCMEFCEVENSGHFPMIDNPAELAKIITSRINPVGC
jgi:pimeloyl-ACP methyl ester carboxylesterase